MIGLAAAIGLMSATAVPAWAAENETAGSSPATNARAGAVTVSQANASPAGAAPANVQPPQVCGSSTLTAGRFVELFYAIASRGDLLDIEFIEQTLQVHFRVSTSTEGGIPNPHSKNYVVDSILGVPIGIYLGVNDDHDQQLSRRFIGILRFDFDGYADCLNLHPLAFTRLFNKPFIPTVFPGTSLEAGQGVNLTGKNESHIHAGFSYRTSDSLVLGAAIQQSP
jgi:hypothetical protein